MLIFRYLDIKQKNAYILHIGVYIGGVCYRLLNVSRGKNTPHQVIYRSGGTITGSGTTPSILLRISSYLAECKIK